MLSNSCINICINIILQTLIGIIFYQDRISFQIINRKVQFNISSESVYIYKYIYIYIYIYAKIQFGCHLQKQHHNLTRILRTFSWQIFNPRWSFIPWNEDNLSVYNISKLYCATLLSIVFKKAQYRTFLDIRDMSYSWMFSSWSSEGFPRSASKIYILHSIVLH